MTRHRNPEKTADQKAQERIILASFASIAIVTAVFAGVLSRDNINANACSQAVHQVQNGGAAR